MRATREIAGGSTLREIDGGSTLSEIAEVAELYAGSATLVRQLVRHGVRAPDPLIEDACQFAWGRLVHHRARVRRETAVAWLVTTARREACKQARREGRELSLDVLLDQLGEPPGISCAPSAEEMFERRAALESLGALPDRQRRLIWLQGLGLSYGEMAEQTGVTTRTVQRQLMHARQRLALAAQDA
jgi:RNA polymerase sigma factor (sigma-70 family)